jgi:hypothetical protein
VSDTFWGKKDMISGKVSIKTLDGLSIDFDRVFAGFQAENDAPPPTAASED